jgi:capsular polysaccharide transport system permease protein
MPMMLFMDAAGAGTSAITANQGLLVYPAIRPIDLVLSRMLLVTVTNGVVFLMMFGGIALWYGHVRVDDPLTMALALPLVALLGAAWGLVCCGLIAIVPSMTNIMSYTTRPIFFISGAFFSTNDLPKQVREILLWNPVLHCVELVRNGWFTNYEVRYVGFAYPAMCIVVLLFFGLALERVVVRQMAR